MAEEPDAERMLAARMRVTAVRLIRRLREQTGDAISPAQLSLLSCLYRSGPMSPRALAVEDGVRPPSVTRMVAGLADRGLITRRPHPTDGRQVVVELTTTGRERIEEEISARERWLERRLAELDADERAALVRAVEIIDRMTSTPPG